MKAILNQILIEKEGQDASALISLVDKIRPRSIKHPEISVENMQNLIAHLKSDVDLNNAFSEYIARLFAKFDPVYLFTSSGILSSHGFFYEFWAKTKHKILPPLWDDHDATTLVNQLFYKKDDYVWVKFIPKELWNELFQLVNVHHLFVDKAASSIVRSIRILSQRVANLGMDEAITQKLPHLGALDSPFLVQNKSIIKITDTWLDQQRSNSLDVAAIHQINTLLEECIVHIRELRRKKNVFGTSLHLTYITQRLLQQIKRLSQLLKLWQEPNKGALTTQLVPFFISMIKAENQRLSLRKLVRLNIDLLAFEVVEHSAKKGGKYIAENPKEYINYFKASMLGGLIIAVFATFKVFMDTWSLSPLGQGLIFSLNYALCFVLVYMVGGIIATKQPAMTASAVARSMDTNDDGHIDNLMGLKNLIIKVSRSQFVSFAGNLICAFPIAILLSKFYAWLLGSSFVDLYKAKGLLSEIDPSQGVAILFAGIAGVFLSLAGLISGYFDNKIVYSQIPLRIRNHPGLKRRFSKMKLAGFSKYIEKHLGALSGNVALGFFLGMAGTIGFISGLPFDIRHIAFSSANFGMALSQGIEVFSPVSIFYGILGILAIGLMNFLVSFGLTLSVAVKSRNITFRQTKELMGLLKDHFFFYPLDFFIPPGIFKTLSASIKTFRKNKISNNSLDPQR